MVTGDCQAALRSLAHIEQCHLQSDGDIVPINNPICRSRHPLYPHAFVVIGAARAGRSSLAEAILGFLVRHRHSVLGGWGERTDRPAPHRYDALSTALVGLAFLESGRFAEATGAACFLERMLKLQPAPGTAFYTSMTEAGELLTALSDPFEQAERRVIFNAPGGVWWAMSFPLYFLARLVEQGGDRHWLDVAKRYFELLERSPRAWNDPSSGKLAAGCAVLYGLSGDSAWRASALRATRALVARQDSDGGWLSYLEGDGGTREKPSAAAYDASAELVQWLVMVGKAVAQRDGTAWIGPDLGAEESLADHLFRQAERLILRHVMRTSHYWHRLKWRLEQRLTS